MPRKDCTALTFDTLRQNSKQFAQQHPFPTKANLIERVAKRSRRRQREVVQQASSVRVLIHPEVHHFLAQFLEHKQAHGTATEQQLYTQLSVEDFIDRLLTKRPLQFVGPQDAYVLRDGRRGQGGFESIGATHGKEDGASLSLEVPNPPLFIVYFFQMLYCPTHSPLCHSVWLSSPVVLLSIAL